MKKTTLLALTAIAGLAAFTSCKKDDDPVVTPTETLLIKGPEVPIGSGIANTWVRTVNGRLEAMGIMFNRSALESFGTDMVSYRLPLPAEAAPSGMTFASLDWSPAGHPPMAIYDTAHFDFHFYYLTDAELGAIPGGPDTVQVAPAYVPASYSFGEAPAMSVPGMGVHYMDLTSPEFQGEDFTKTFVFGYTAGQLAFLEPMVSKAYFLKYPNASAFIPQPAAYQRANLLYPTRYTVKADSAKSEFGVSLDAFSKR